MKRYDPAFQYMAKQMQGLDPIYLARFHNFSGSFDYVNEIFTLQGREMCRRNISVRENWRNAPV